MVSSWLKVVLVLFWVILMLVVVPVPLRLFGLVLVVVTVVRGLILLACCVSVIRVRVDLVRLGLMVCSRLHSVVVLL